MRKYRDGKVRNCPICKENIAECKCKHESLKLDDVCPICKEKECKCYKSEKNSKTDPIL